MKLKQVSIACGLAMAAMGAQAANIEIVVSGSSALDPNFRKIVADACTAGQPASSYYLDGTGQSFVCVANGTGFGAATGDTLTVFKNSSGSGQGVTNIFGAGTALNAPNVTGQGCVRAADNTDPLNLRTETFSGVTFDRFSGCAVISKTPKIGLSDVEPGILLAVGGVSAAAANGVIAAPLVAQGFGVPLSDKLYLALQQTQQVKGMIPASCSTTANANGGPTDTTEACAPSVSSAWLRGMFTGVAKDWGVAGSDVAAQLAANGVNTNVVWCRRSVTSGTQATFASRLGGKGCLVSGSQTFFLATQDDNPNNNANNQTNTAGNGGFIMPGGSGGNYTIVQNNNATLVSTCLDSFDGNNDAAVGILGLDLQPTSSNKWHFAKVDGIYPSNDNIIDGLYDNLMVEASINVSSTTPLTGAYPAALTYMKAAMGSPTTISTLGLNGLGALPNPGLGYNWDSARNWATNPVMSGTRGGNTCAPVKSSF